MEEKGGKGFVILDLRLQILENERVDDLQILHFA
jgi:hypothetical protein